MARKYWDDRFNDWRNWMSKGGIESDFPWIKDWNFPKDALKKDSWKWGNSKHSAHIIPEPYWGNPIDPSVVFVNINPGKVSDISSPQAEISKISFDLSYFEIAAKNHFNLTATQNWHSKRFKWAHGLDSNIDPLKGLSIELIPWHSESASDVTKYIIENRKSVIENLIRFEKTLPKKGIFKDTFVVRSAAFMDLLNIEDFASYFQIEKMKHHILSRKGHIDKPISFLTIVYFKKKYGNTRFIIFHGGSNNDMPSIDYLVQGTDKTLKEYLKY